MISSLRMLILILVNYVVMLLGEAGFNNDQSVNRYNLAIQNRMLSDFAQFWLCESHVEFELSAQEKADEPPEAL